MRFKKMYAIILSAAIALSPVSVPLSDQHALVAQAHSGRTDSNGGHVRIHQPARNSMQAKPVPSQTQIPL